MNNGEFYTSREKYISLIEQLDLKDRVVLHDRFIADEDVRYYFSAADTLILPYRSATQSGVTQIAYNFENGILPKSVRKSGSGSNSLLIERNTEANKSTKRDNRISLNSKEATTIAAEQYGEYTTSRPAESVSSSDAGVDIDSLSKDELHTLIERERKAMEEAAKQLDFQNAAKHRDRMYELQKIKERKVRD